MIKKIRSFFLKSLIQLEDVMATKNGGRLIIVGIFIISISLIVGSIYFSGHDKFIEEAAEDIIEKHVGIRLDLTPSSVEEPETNK